MATIGSKPQLSITQLLQQLRAGDESARAELMNAAYAALHRIARSHLRRERPAHTLQPTALVNEAYLKLFGRSAVEFNDRIHFFAAVSQTMRRILVDHARAHASARRISRLIQLHPGIEAEADADRQPIDLLELDLAMEALARENISLVQLIEMRYFGGMTAEETAEVGRSVHAIRHDLRLAHAWLRRALARQP